MGLHQTILQPIAQHFPQNIPIRATDAGFIDVVEEEIDAGIDRDAPLEDRIHALLVREAGHTKLVPQLIQMALGPSLVVQHGGVNRVDHLLELRQPHFSVDLVLVGGNNVR